MRYEKIVPVALSPDWLHDEGMAADRDSLQVLKNIVSQVDLLISTTEPMPENRTPRCQELLRAADAVVDDLIKQAGKPARHVA